MSEPTPTKRKRGRPPLPPELRKAKTPKKMGRPRLISWGGEPLVSAPLNAPRVVHEALKDESFSLLVLAMSGDFERQKQDQPTK
jgi:hypothetical protein